MKQSVEIWNAHSVEGCFRKIFRLFSRRSNGERYITTRSVFEHHPGHISFFAKNPQPEILIVNLDFPNMKWHPKDLSIKLRKSHIQKKILRSADSTSRVQSKYVVGFRFPWFLHRETGHKKALQEIDDRMMRSPSRAKWRSPTLAGTMYYPRLSHTHALERKQNVDPDQDIAFRHLGA